jgi:hypothetical protein
MLRDEREDMRNVLVLHTQPAAAFEDALAPLARAAHSFAPSDRAALVADDAWRRHSVGWRSARAQRLGTLLCSCAAGRCGCTLDRAVLLQRAPQRRVALQVWLVMLHISMLGAQRRGLQLRGTGCLGQHASAAVLSLAHDELAQLTAAHWPSLCAGGAKMARMRAVWYESEARRRWGYSCGRADEWDRTSIRLA